MKQENYDGRVYEKCYAKRKHLFGIKVAGEKGWYVEPCFEELGTRKYVTDDVPEVWFKQNGRYGLYNVGERRVVLPAVYGFPFDFGSKGEYATVWKDYKAGVIDRQGNEVVPIIYDEIEARTECITIPNEQRREVTLDDGQSWDEGIHFPAYQDEYFTHPFHALYLDYFNYSFEDLCNINDFRVNIDVRLETREQEKKEV